MTERPILFSAPMVRAILAGAKTQTRRVMKPDGKYRLELVAPPGGGPSRCPYGQPGDRLWVREAFNDDRAETIYRADGGLPADWFDAGSKWRPSIHMPRRASRITLEVTGVCVERLQAITVGDCIAEGIPRGGPENPDDIERREYRALWESINGPDSWDANPWVWCVEFRRIDAAMGEKP